MSESAEKVKAGAEHSGQACRWCAVTLADEDDVAICTECKALHHEACWDRELGCADTACVNAPLTRLDAQPAARPHASSESGEAKADSAEPPRRRKKKRTRGGDELFPRRAEKRCIECKRRIDADEDICPICHAINTPDGLYHGPKTTAPGATKAFIIAILGLFVCGIALGPWAIAESGKAKALIQNDPRLGGEGLATAAYYIGIADILLMFVWIAIRVAR